MVVSNQNDASRVLEPIVEDDDELHAAGLPEIERRRSTAKFQIQGLQKNVANRNICGDKSSPEVPSVASSAVFNPRLLRATSEHAKIAEDARDRRDTFRPPFDPA